MNIVNTCISCWDPAQSDAARFRADGGARLGEALAAGSSHRRGEDAIICAWSFVFSYGEHIHISLHDLSVALLLALVPMYL